MTKEKLFEEQLMLESSARQDGYEATCEALRIAKEKGMVDTALPIGQAFFNHKVLAVKDVMLQWLTKNMKPKAGVKPNFIYILDDLKTAFTDAEGNV